MEFTNPFESFKSELNDIDDIYIDFAALNISNGENEKKSFLVVLDDEARENFSSDNTKFLLKEAGIFSEKIEFFSELGIFRIELNPDEFKTLSELEGIRSIELDENIESIDPLRSYLNIRNEIETNIDLTHLTEQKYDFKLDFDEKNLTSPEKSFFDLSDWERFYDNYNNQNLPDNQLNSFEISSLPPIYSDGRSVTGDILPYGIKAVWEGSDVGERGNIGSGTYAFVLDTGVVGTQTDLNINKRWGKSFISGQDAYIDGHGHGTHVAGTIGALANGVGVIGVAPGAEIVPIKVLSDSGYGSWSSIIQGIDYCVKVIEDNNLDKNKCVLNLSLGGGYSSAVDNAVKRAADKGILFSLAAGNSSRDADGYSPAAAGDHENVYTISAVDNKYLMPMFSNWDDPVGGDDVDFAAPGVSVLSYTKTGSINAWSGTSMAAPHVAGALLLGDIKEGPMVRPNGWGYPDPFAFVNYDESSDPPEDPEDPEDPPEDPPSGEIKVTVYNQSSLNGRGVGDDSDETKNLLSVVKNEIDEGEKFKLNYSLKSFSNTVKLREILSDTDVFLMPEIEYWLIRYDSEAKNILKDFVEGGGTFIQTGDYSNNDVRFLNDIFGWDLGGRGTANSGSLLINSSNAKGTKFEGGPTRLSNINVTSMISRGSVSNFQAIYGNDSGSSVAIIEKGLGQVIYLGEDYYSFGYANNWGEGTHRQGLYTKDSRYSHWVTEMIPRAIHSAIPPTKYSTVSGKYYYGNGDWYEFSGTISEKHGGGSFSEGEKIYADSYDSDAFTKVNNETGNRGYYHLEKVTNTQGTQANAKTKISIGNYFDVETFLNISPYNKVTGELGLGSEKGFLSSKQSTSNDNFDNFLEADVYTILEKEGTTSLTKDNDQFFYVNSASVINDIKRSGEKVNSNSSRDFELIAAEKIGGTNQVIDHNDKSGEVYVWQTDENWDFIKDLSYSRANDYYYYQIEKDFNIDLNNDDTIGLRFTTKESSGVDHLLSDHLSGFHVKDESGIIHDIKRNGRKINSNSSWSKNYRLIAAETINNINQVVDYNDNTGEVYIWQTDENWDFIKDLSYSKIGYNSFYQIEKDFNVDLNNDDLTTKETSGVDYLLSHNLGWFYVKDESGYLHDIKRNGRRVNSNWSKEFELIAAETINGTNQVIDHNDKSGEVYVWQTDENWDFIKDLSYSRAIDYYYYQIEKDFNIDLNNDDTIGLRFTTKESSGVDHLLSDHLGGFHVKDESEIIHDIRRNGRIVDSKYRLKAAETIDGINRVLDYNDKTGEAYVWQTDENWDFVKDLNYSRTDKDSFYQIEKDFNIDLNNDDTIGLKFTTKESTGVDHLLSDHLGGFHVKDESEIIHDIRRNGRIVDSKYRLKAAETIDGINRVLDYNDESGEAYVWQTDENWDFIKDLSYSKIGHDTIYLIEKDFNMDLNNDGLTPTETSGDDYLLGHNLGWFYVKDETGYLHDIRRNGRRVNSNWSKDYELIAVETIGGINQVIDHNDKSGEVYVWQTDRNWDFVKDLNYSRPGEESFFKIEENFQLDINNDGFFGNPII